MSKKINIAILGASGYTGAELVRILHLHPSANITCLTGDSQAGKSIGEVYPHLRHLSLPPLVTIEQADFSKVEAVFCCLPHGTTQAVIAGLPQHVKVIDLSADFRLADANEYAKWYGHAHQAVELQKEAVYGLTELARDQVKKARLVANPGCYPTSAQLPLIPLLKAGAIEKAGIVIDSKSGITGAGRSAKQANLYSEASEGISAYGIASHRHTPEIEQGLSQAAGSAVAVTFTPHLMPMNRGILSTIYVKLAGDHNAKNLRHILMRAYQDEPFVQVMPEGIAPSTHQVRGTNLCAIGVFAGRIEGQAILVSVIDNLVKGASGQAVQNMNLMFGLPETTGLQMTAMFP
jgi:N-acetyl-gamma-glutamyl-phosphate reductase